MVIQYFYNQRPTNNYHIEYGRHSNIPECCIKYFLNNDVVNDSGPRNWGYVPCPDCVIKKNKVKIHICTVKCIPFLHSIGNTTYPNYLKYKAKEKLRKINKIKAQKEYLCSL